MIGRSMAVMAAVPAAISGGDINLSGTTGIPNSSLNFESGMGPGGTAIAGWRFNLAGDVQRYQFGSLVAFNPTPDEWYDPNGSPDTTYYIRATQYSGDAPNLGSAVGSILALSSSQWWYWQQTGDGSLSGVLLIEIFDDAIGTTLLASGYYSGSATYVDEPL